MYNLGYTIRVCCLLMLKGVAKVILGRKIAHWSRSREAWQDSQWQIGNNNEVHYYTHQKNPGMKRTSMLAFITMYSLYYSFKNRLMATHQMSVGSRGSYLNSNCLRNIRDKQRMTTNGIPRACTLQPNLLQVVLFCTIPFALCDR